MTPHRIAIVGFGKIAVDQHVPAILANPGFELSAIVSRRGAGPDGVPVFPDLDQLFSAMPDVDVLAVCTPPSGRTETVRRALAAGRHVLIEKPPAATLGEIEALAGLADRAGRVLFATWHSRFNQAVVEARRTLVGKRLRRLAVDWREDVRRWHPNQAWIWREGGFGVFDPGINALSIVTEIVPQSLFVAAADMDVPANCQTPIGARLRFATLDGPADLGAVFDWRKEGEQHWEIAIETEDGMSLHLAAGGATLTVDGVRVVDEAPREYPMIYERFRTLLAEGRSDVDIRPLRLVADSCLLGSRTIVDPFVD